ncbi:hypothetical protein [Sinorhizobium meliloti]|uniref:hypothetical protein n=1 Tax=Rhizobium meliloti TaxID=382 RepID=UPI00338EF3F2
MPVGTSAHWKYEPFSATREGDWLYGRGAGDILPRRRCRGAGDDGCSPVFRPRYVLQSSH